MAQHYGHLIRAAAVAAFVLAAAGCTGPGEATRRTSDNGWVLTVTPAPVPSVPAPDELDRATLPLTGYVATNEQRHLVDKAYARMLNQCMAQFGYAPRFIEPEDTPLPQPVPITWRYGVSDPEDAARHGYRLPSQYQIAETNEKERARARYEANPMQGMELAIYDGAAAGSSRGGVRVPPGGCQGEVARRLGATNDGDYLDDLLAQSLRLVGFDHSRQDPRVIEAIGKWRACLSRAGHTATDPQGAAAPYAGLKTAPTAAEIQNAVVDARCKRETNLVATWYTVEYAYQVALIDANRAALEKGRHSVNAAVHAAAEVMGAPVPPAPHR
jgi:hypothetical protein